MQDIFASNRRQPYIFVQANLPLPDSLRPFLEQILGNPPARDIVIRPPQFDQLRRVALGQAHDATVPLIRADQGTRVPPGRVAITLDAGRDPGASVLPSPNPQPVVIGQNVTDLQAGVLDLAAVNAANQEERAKIMLRDQRLLRAQQGLASIEEEKKSEAERQRVLVRAPERPGLAGPIVAQERGFPGSFDGDTEAADIFRQATRPAPVRAPTGSTAPPAERFFPDPGDPFNPEAEEFVPRGSGLANGFIRTSVQPEGQIKGGGFIKTIRPVPHKPVRGGGFLRHLIHQSSDVSGGGFVRQASHPSSSVGGGGFIRA